MFPTFRVVACSLGGLAAMLAVNTFLLGRMMDNTRVVVIYIAVTLGLYWFDRAKRRTARHRDGWNHLTVSWGQWVIAVVLLAVTLLLIMIFFNFGSARSDAAYQLSALQCLIAGSSLLTAAMGWFSFSSVTRWNDDVIEQDTLFMGRRAIRFADIVGVRHVIWTDSIRIEGEDGAVINIPSMHNGSQEFLETLMVKLGLVDEEKEEEGAEGG